MTANKKSGLWLRVMWSALFLMAGISPGFCAFKIVGYFPSWQGSVSGIQFSKVTHVNYAFLLPNTNGTLQAIDNASKLQSLVTSGHAAGVKVSISVGGWNDGDDSAFRCLATNAAYRATFVNNLSNFVNQYNLDGVDIDWEYPNTTIESTNYTALMATLATVMHNQGKLLTAAVVAYGGNYISNSVFASVDWLNIMDYDNTDGVDQSTYTSALTALDYWITSRGLPASKTMLGVPFYSDPSDFEFSQLLQKGADPNADVWGTEGYNGLPTIRNKTVLALGRCGGLMMWDLSQDATGTNSLLSAMHDVIAQLASGLPAGWTNGDIGKVGMAGSTWWSNSVFHVKGSGSDIWNAADQFHFVYQSKASNVSVTARIATEQNTQSFAKAGVMIRQTAATNSPEVDVVLSPTNGVSLIYRATTGASSMNASGWVAGPQAPYWVRLARFGNTFTGYVSSNGVDWTTLASANVAMTNSLTGLAVTAHDTNQLNAATFDNVSLVSAPPPPQFGGAMDPGTNLVFHGANGVAGWNFYLLSSTNPVLPLTNWTRLTTNIFGPDGSCNYTSAIDPNLPAQYYILQMPQ